MLTSYAILKLCIDVTLFSLVSSDILKNCSSSLQETLKLLNLHSCEDR